MWYGEISRADLATAGRWNVAYFSEETTSDSSAYPMLALGTLVDERRGTVDPQGVQADAINYLGLENVRSNTGELVDFAPRPPHEIKSRSKTFKSGDVLFGRLRPELNKVYLAEDNVAPGICSNEFIVLVAKKDVINPRFLRHVLASAYVTQFATKLRMGGSLPRMSSADLLDLHVPVPPMDVQTELANILEAFDRRLRQLRRQVERLPQAVSEALVDALVSGKSKLPELMVDLQQPE